jgi:hypothetical protein
MKYYLITFVLGVAFGFFVSFMYCTMGNDAPPSKPIATITKELKKEVAKSEVNFTKSVDLLKQRSAKLQVELSDTKNELTKAKQKNYSLQLSVYDLLDKKLEEKQSNANSDSSCDSLIVTVEQLMESSSVKDSLYEKMTINLEDQLRNKDSTIEIKEKQYSDVKSAFTKTTESVNELSAQNRFLAKQVKKQRFKSKVLSAALFVLTGAVANYIIHH